MTGFRTSSRKRTKQTQRNKHKNRGIQIQKQNGRKDEEAIYGVPKNLLQTGPAVVSINGIVASLAVTEFMVSVVKLRRPNRLLYYHGHRGIVTISSDKPYSDCYYCNYIRGRKDAAGVDSYWKKK